MDAAGLRILYRARMSESLPSAAPKLAAAPGGKTAVHTCQDEITGWVMDILSPVPDSLYDE